jgi:type I restriction enzyme, R subunit
VEGLTPEQGARQEIDKLLKAAGWAVQDYKAMNLAAARGVAVREFPTPTGPMDYMLYVDRRGIGSVEAKKVGETLLGVEPQADRYSKGFTARAKKDGIPFWKLPLSFHYISTGIETVFTSRLDPDPRPRPTFAFHRPDSLAEWVQQDKSLRTRLREMPQLNRDGLREIQEEAIVGLEKSFAENRPRTLVPMTMGAGKTYVAVAEAYRLIRYAGAKRIFFMVDRRNLGQQALREFQNYVVPDENRKFGELYGVQLLESNHVDPAAKVVIGTVQRLYSILRDEPEMDVDLEEASAFEAEEQGSPELEESVVVNYQPKVPIETFDFLFTDECHRSIYGRWGQVIEYFDSFLIGLTATPSKFTYVYFDGNVVAEYTHEQSVLDGVNVDYLPYRIATAITEGGSKIEKGEWVKVRDKRTRAVERRALGEEIAYGEDALDRSVVSPDQIRTVVRTFRDKLFTDLFPGRIEVPKTVVFCKDDAHAEDVLQVVREEFAKGSEFARKITYKTQGSTDEHIQDFRTDPKFRIAVSVDQISTGTDIRPIECLVFMRFVKSRSLWAQMMGRGVRRIDPTDLAAVSPDAGTKDHFVLVDAVGITDEDMAWVDSKPLDRDPSVPLTKLLQDVAVGITRDDVISTVGARLLRLASRATPEQETAFAKVSGGKSLEEIAKALVAASDPDVQFRAAAEPILNALPENERKPLDEIEVSDEQQLQARMELVDAAVAPLMDPDVREAIQKIQTQTEQIIDLASVDQVTFAGFTDRDEAEKLAEGFEDWIKEHRDEYVALKAYFERPYTQRLKYEDIRELAKAIEAPPLYMTPDRLWEAYRRLDSAKVRGSGHRVLTDIVSLLRFALNEDDELVPHADVVKLRFDLWLHDQQSNGHKFTADQTRWLEMVRDHIATSMTIEREDFDLEPFRQEGGLVGAYRAFGDQLDTILSDLNEKLVAA